MYGYKNSTAPIIEDVFNNTSQQAVFKHVFGDFQVNSYITSPFRPDSSPGCWIMWNKGKLYFTDFTMKSPALDMIGIIQKKYDLSLSDALDFIIEGKFEGEAEYSNPLNRKSFSSQFLLDFCPKPFDKHARNYWKQYDISSKELIQDSVFSTAYYSAYSAKTEQWYTVTPHAIEATYTICYPDTSLKICRAKINKTSIQPKWITNTSKNTIGGLKSLPFIGSTLIITKSYKDWRVLTNLGLTCIYFQNEGMIPDWEILSQILPYYTNIIVWFDNDNAGKQASIKLKNLINSYYPNKATSITLPTKEKDPADVIKAGKKEQLIKFINNYIFNF